MKIGRDRFYVSALATLSFLLVISPSLGLQYSQSIPSYGAVSYTDGALSWLHTDGRWIKDSAGRKIRLVGACTTGPEAAVEDIGVWSQYELYYDVMKREGANHCRLFMNPYFTPFFGHSDGDHYMRILDTIVGFCKARNIWITMDYFYPLSQGVQQYYDLANPSFVATMVDFWKWFAGYYKNEPTVVGFGIMNEPPGPWTGVSGVTREQYFNVWRNYADKVCAAITEVNPNALKFVGSINGCCEMRDWRGNDLPYTNVVYSFHRYYCFDLRASEAYAVAYRDGRFAEAKSLMEQKYELFLLAPEVPVFYEEFGHRPTEVSGATNWQQWLEDVFRLCEQYEIGFSYFRMWRDEPGTLLASPFLEGRLSESGEIWAKHL